MLRQAVINLVDNAIKHTPQGGAIRIRVGADGGHAILDVIDNGPGVEVERARRIFDRFHSGAPARDAEDGGLGLSIAKRAVEANGGTLTLAARRVARKHLPDRPAGSAVSRGRCGWRASLRRRFPWLTLQSFARTPTCRKIQKSFTIGGRPGSLK